MSTSAPGSMTSGTTAEVPLLVPFTVNFTITNLHYMEDMAHLGSEIFNTTERTLQYLLKPLFQNSSVGFRYTGCRLTLLRAEKAGKGTEVDAVCTYQSDPTGFRINREWLYWQLSQQTRGITRLGFYTLDKNSLYVNGYNHRYWSSTTSNPVTSTYSPELSTSSIPSSPGTSPSLVPFTLNFTITNLHYTEDMGPPGSQIFNTTERILNRWLRPLFQNSSIGSLYAGCRLTLLRPEKNRTATGVDAVCTHHPDPMDVKLDREQLYWELSQLTHGITHLGSFTLDSDSLYVNGYTHRASTPTPSTTSPALVPFTLNFTITSLQYTKDMKIPGSSKFNKIEQTLQDLLEPLFKNTSIGVLYSSCRLTSLRPEKDESATGVDMTCTHHFEPMSTGLDREQVYWELSRETHGVTQLGFFSLDKNSLYVNGYNHQALTSTPSFAMTSSISPATSTSPLWISTAAGPFLVPFTLNFTIINLQYEEDMRHPGSWKFNSTERILQSLLRPLFKQTSVGPMYSGCRLILLRPKNNGAATAVDTVCTYRPDHTGIELDRERLYWELSRITNTITRLGPYTLDQDSLYVNGYTHQAAETTPSTTASPLVPFTLNFTITNLRFREDMRPPGSGKFNITEKVLQGLLGPLFKNTSVGPLYSGCRLTLLRERLYWELNQLTYSVSRLGPYTLDQDSLYVNATGPTGPPRVPFTLNFTITNLRFTEDMETPGSWKFNITEKFLQDLLSPLFKNTSVGALFSGCRLTLLRSEKDGTATGVDAVCTHRPDPTGHELDREQLYWELSQLTHSVTWLGPYTLDQDSLYVNGYTHKTSGTTPSTTASPLVPFTLNFTITNLRFKEDMQPPGSWKFNITEKVLQGLLGPLFKNTSVGPLYSGCRLTVLRPEKDGAATGVNAVCTYRPDPMGRELDREWLYWELSQLTHSVSRLGPYTLDQDSLYVNGYTHRTSETTPSTTGSPLVPFTLNFTITNLHFTEDMQPLGSWKFNITEKFLQGLLEPLFQNTSVGPLYSGCRLTMLRVQELSAIAMVLRETVPPMSTSSLIQHGQSSPYPAAATRPPLVLFTLNFTITNLRFTEDMESPGSGKFNITEKFLQGLLRPLFKNSSIGSLYNGCRLTSLRPKKNGAATGVDAVCTHHPDPTGHELDREWLYWELSQLTHGITLLGPYTLDQDSLYVNGYTHPASSTIPSTTGPTLVPFTLNFTITNMLYTEDMGHPGSLKFNSTERALQRRLGPLLNKTSIGPFYTGCRLASLRQEKDGAATRVDLICTIHPDPTGREMDRELLYWELNHDTYGITRLGPFLLDRDSLYVNGYTYGSAASNATTGDVSKEPFTLNFTINNLRYSTDMGHRGSLKFNITDTVMQHLLSPLFQRSSLGARYAGCRVTALRSVKNGAQTRVDILCTFQQPPHAPGLPAKRVFHELSRQTHGITRLGPYSLDKDSLYLNAVGHNLKTFTLNFTISNLQYSPDMGNDSVMFNSTERVLQHLLGPLFQKSILGPFYSGCRLTSLRPEKDRTATGVDAICIYHPDPMGSGLDRERLYWELSQLTHGVTQLDFYTLERDSLFVDGYAPRNLSTQSEYQINFHIINWNLSSPDPTSSEYIALLRDIQDKVTTLYIGSQLQDVFRFCVVTNLTLDSMLVTVKTLFSSYLDPNLVKQVFLDKTLIASSHWLGSTYQLADVHVTEVEPPVHPSTEKPIGSPSSQHFQLNFTITNLPYSQDTAQPSTIKYQRNKRSVENAKLDRVAIYEEFLQMTQNGTHLQKFTLNRNSVLVDDLPFWAIILICLAGLLVLIICLICCFLVTTCLRKKEGDYEVQRHRLGYYLPHLDLRKLE
ncbi:Mucin-16 [Tupaia chinensis]|uniref:Mucin-16 n=1 Tax=Tupaia chinensis TaxID=246437 RepID=L9JVC2_TUPCH|nr:Mucin-16 [Tupaia chinensis]